MASFSMPPASRSNRFPGESPGFRTGSAPGQPYCLAPVSNISTAHITSLLSMVGITQNSLRCSAILSDEPGNFGPVAEDFRRFCRHPCVPYRSDGAGWLDVRRRHFQERCAGLGADGSELSVGFCFGGVCPLVRCHWAITGDSGYARLMASKLAAGLRSGHGNHWAVQAERSARRLEPWDGTTLVPWVFGPFRSRPNDTDHRCQLCVPWLRARPHPRNSFHFLLPISLHPGSGHWLARLQSLLLRGRTADAVRTNAHAYRWRFPGFERRN